MLSVALLLEDVLSTGELHKKKQRLLATYSPQLADSARRIQDATKKEAPATPTDLRPYSYGDPIPAILLQDGHHLDSSDEPKFPIRYKRRPEHAFLSV